MLRGRRLLALSGLGVAFMVITAGHGHAGVTASADLLKDGVDAHGLTMVNPNGRIPETIEGSPPGRRDQVGDIAFWGNTAVMFDGQVGRASGFRVLDVSDPAHPKVLGVESREGNTTHIAIWRHLVIISVDDITPGDDDNLRGGCNEDESETETRFVGLMVYSIKHPAEPLCLGKVATGPGTAHTFTVLPDLQNNRLLAYVSRLPRTGDRAQTIDLVTIPLNKPGNPQKLGPVSVAPLEGNHDMTVFAPLKLGVVLDPGLGFVLWDLSNPEKPETIGVVRTNVHASASGNNNHSAAFSWDGKYLVVGEEVGGALAAPPTAGEDEGPIGRLRFYSVQQIIEDYDELKRLAGGTTPALGDLNVTAPVSTYAIPGERADGESPFLPHNFNVLPIRPDRHADTDTERILSIGWMRGGTSLIDFTDPREPAEIGHWVVRGVDNLSTQAHSNAYASLWYRGHIYVTNAAEDGLLQQYLNSQFGTAAPESTRPSRVLDILKLDTPSDYAWAQRVAHLPRLNYSLQEGNGALHVQHVVTATEPAGDPVLKAVVRNTGYAIAPATGITFTLDGQPLGDARTPPLEPGHSATVTLPWTPPADTERHILTVVAANQATDNVETVNVAVYGDQIEH